MSSRAYLFPGQLLDHHSSTCFPCNGLGLHECGSACLYMHILPCPEGTPSSGQSLHLYYTNHYSFGLSYLSESFSLASVHLLSHNTQSNGASHPSKCTCCLVCCISILSLSLLLQSVLTLSTCKFTQLAQLIFGGFKIFLAY